MQKHVLFYSKFCQYSTEVIRVLTRKDLRSRFVMVCVDGNRHQIPHFVDRVPVILTTEKRLLTDEAVFAFINEAEGVSADPAGAELGGGISGEFSFVEGSPAVPQVDGTFGYMTLTGMDDFPRIYTPADDNATKSSETQWQQASTSSPSIDNLMASRENELNSWLPRTRT